MFNQTLFLRTMMLIMAAKNQESFREQMKPAQIPSHNDSLTTCYEPYGCFSIASPWTSLTRPITLFPESPYKINPQFCLLTRSNFEMVNCSMVNDNPASFYSTHFNRNHWTFFVTHGYLESMMKDWIYRLARALLDREPANVILVNWSGGSGPPYSQAVANIRVAAAVTSKMIYTMHKSLGLSTSKLHLIGHSLGAHLSSYIGHTFIEKYQMKIARITACDPAEPHFSKTHTDVRLDPSDADFVDVIHTDAVPFISGGLGLMDPVGHVDFYPNGGSHQPGCGDGVGKHILEAEGSFVQGLTKTFGCNHVRSNDYLIESLKPSQCPFLGFQCNSFENFEDGKCTVFKSIMEPHIKSPGPPVALPLGLESIRLKTMGVGSWPVKLYLKTAPRPPFCRSHYKLSIKISDRKEGGEIGMFFITVSGENDDTSPMPLQKINSYYEAGNEYHFVVNGETVGLIRSIQVLWKYEISFTNPLTWRINIPKIHIAWIKVQHLEFGDSILVCPENDYLTLLSGSPLTFNKTNGIKKC